ncbi:MAG: efflux RND transporter periplasmic adaptor subunit [Pseudomonadales bacterium]|jgi:membrane fusion protein (multidrug efflux system)|nr:efflux RND transporter periplasmic adaptor subunit [Pseudomonadales bacterium]
MTRHSLAWPALFLTLALGACGAEQAPQQRGNTGGAAPEAGYVVLSTQDVPLEIELAGRTSAYETSDVRPQVSGIIKSRLFTEGALVEQGDTLYEIDPSLYQAAVNQAQADLTSARATAESAKAKAERYEPLVAIEAVSQQDYTDAFAASKQAEARVAQSEAALQTARINLGYTQVKAPITGRIGRSVVTTGALVTNAQAQALTSIDRLDPIFVDIQQSSADMLALRNQLAAGGAVPGSTEVKLTLEDGSTYAQTGQLQFAESIVEPSTGSVTLRAEFSNPDGLLLPGMFVRARLSQAVARNAILVPQQGLSRDPRGNATVMLVGAGDLAELRNVVAPRTVGDKWLVTQGLGPGDRVIVEGLDRIQPGAAIRPVPAGSSSAVTSNQ